MKAKILFIDDEPQWVDSFKRLLENDNYEVVTATNVADALKTINATSDLKVVLTDLMLPEGIGDDPEGSAGMRLLESVRQKRPELPVIVVSGYLEPYAKDLGTLGAFAFISKGSRDSIEKIRIQIHKAVEDYESKLGKRLDDSSMLTALRNELLEEINKYSPLKERTIYVPDEGPYELIKPLVGFKR